MANYRSFCSYDFDVEDTIEYKEFDNNLDHEWSVYNCSMYRDEVLDALSLIKYKKRNDILRVYRFFKGENKMIIEGLKVNDCRKAIPQCMYIIL